MHVLQDLLCNWDNPAWVKITLSDTGTVVRVVMLINIVGIVTVIVSVIVAYCWRKLKQDRPPGITFSLVSIIVLLYGWFMYYHACSC